MHRTLLNDIPDDTELEVYETDCGLLDGDDGGYSNFHELCQEEDALRNVPSGVYRLLGESTRKHNKNARNTRSAKLDDVPFKYGQGRIASTVPTDEERLFRASTGILAPETPESNSHGRDSNYLEEAKYNSIFDDRQSGRFSFQFPNDLNWIDDGPSLISSNMATAPNILQIIGGDNVVVRTIQVVEEVHKLRLRAFDIISRDAKRANSVKSEGESKEKKEPSLIKHNEYDSNASGEIKIEQTSPKVLCTKPEPKLEAYQDISKDDVIEISTATMQPESGLGRCVESRHRAMGHGICALLAAHAGFTHSSTRALHISTDLLEHFVSNIGKILQTSRMETETDKFPTIEQVRIIGNCGFRGGMSDLMCYVRYDLVIAEQAILEAREKLRMRLGEHKGRLNENFRKSPGHGINSFAKSFHRYEKGQLEQENHTATVNAELLVNDVAFSFGYLNPNVHLDVLNGVRVPKELVYNGNLKEEKIEQKQTDIPTDYEAIETDEQSHQWLESMGLQ